MKKALKFKSIFLALLLTFTMSCNNEFLEQKPLSFLNPENTFVDAKGLQTALDASLRMVFRQMNQGTCLLVFDINMSDAAVIGATDKQDCVC